jgi:uncharacterized damage-inducible protein DinB
LTRRSPESASLGDSILGAWATNDRTTIFLVERIPDAMWNAEVPGTTRKTVRMLAAHIHNARRGWIRTLGRPHGLAVPEAVDRRRVTRAQLVHALRSSGRAMANLLAFGLAQGGRIPPTPAYVWRNLPLDVGHVLAYFAAHEGHHRGQILLIARALGKPLPRETVNGLWGWTRFSKAEANTRHRRG